MLDLMSYILECSTDDNILPNPHRDLGDKPTEQGVTSFVETLSIFSDPEILSNLKFERLKA